MQTSFSVDVSSPADRTTTHQVDMTQSSVDTFMDTSGRTFTRSELHTHISPTTYPNASVTDKWYGDTTKIEASADGTTTTTSYVQDPRFGMADPFASITTITTPSYSLTRNASRTTTSCTAGDPFSCASIEEDTWNNSAAHRKRTWTALGNTLQDVSPVGREVDYTLDSIGRTTGITPTGSDVTCIYPTTITYGSNSYDKNQIYTIQQGSGGTCTGADTTRTTTITRASSGGTEGFIAEVDAPIQDVTYTPDNNGRMTGIALPGSRSISVGYDDNGTMTSLLTPLSHTHSFTPNSLNLLGTYEPPAIGGTGYWSTLYDYDLDGLVVDMRPPTNSVVSYTRDAAGRIVQTTYPHPVSGTVTVTANYDASTTKPCTSTAGGCSATNSSVPTITTTDAYDGNLLTAEETAISGGVDETVHWTYDSTLEVATRYIGSSCGSNCASFTRDDDGVVTQVGLDGQTLVVTRSTTNNLVSCISVAGSCETYTYNKFGEVLTDTTKNHACDSGCMQHSPATTVYDVTYTRDSTGRITQKAETVSGTPTTWLYTYDTGFKTFLSCASTTSCASPNFSYDKDGNGSTITADEQDRMSAAGTAAYTYTADGQLSNIHWGSTNDLDYFYDPLGNLRHSDYKSSGTVIVQHGYAIDWRKRRVQYLTNGSPVSTFLYDGDRVIGEVAGSNVYHFIYVTKSNVPDLMVIYNGSTYTVYRIVSDQIGSVRAVIDTSGTTAEALSYGAYGVSSVYPAFQPFGFAGGLYDGSYKTLGAPAYRFGARDYDPTHARWMSKDPIRFMGGSNFYAYCDDDPVNCVDPNGHASIAVTGEPAILVGIDIIIAGDCLLYGCDHTLVPLYNYFFPQGAPANDNGKPCDSDKTASSPSDDKEKCYPQYLVDTASCGELYNDDYYYEMCMTNAWVKYIREHLINV